MELDSDGEISEPTRATTTSGDYDDGSSSISVKVKSGNQQDDESIYGSEDFDDQSTLGRKSGEEYEYGEDDDDDYTQYSDSRATEGGSAKVAEGSGLAEAASGEGVQADDTVVVGQRSSMTAYGEPSTSTYADDFAVDDDDSATRGTVQSKSNISNTDQGNDDAPRIDANIPNIPYATTGSNDDSDETGDKTSSFVGDNVNNRGHSDDVGISDVEKVKRGPSMASSSISRKVQDGPEEVEIMIYDGGDEDGGDVHEVGSMAMVGLAKELQEQLQPPSMENERLAATAEAMGRIGDRKISGDDGDSGSELEILRSQVEAARAMILSSLDDGANDKSDRSLLELVLLAESRGYKQAEKAVTVNKATRKSSSSAPGTHSVGARSAESIARTELERRVESLERDLARAGQESRAQSTRATNLQRKLDARGGGGGGAGGRSGSWVAVDSNGGGRKAGENDEGVATADILALKAKATQLVERLRQEKTARLKAERRTQGVAGKVQVLSDHIEKLMMFLKHEATQKTKAHDQQRRLQKELELVKARSTALLRSNQAKDRVMTELREGSKILEDQLRLMDEKYMELRTKLDWTRQRAGKDVRKARAQASALRTKWALLCGDGGGGENSLLDSMTVDAPFLGHSTSAPGVCHGAAAVAGGGGGGARRGGGGNTNSGSWLHGKSQQHHRGRVKGGGEVPPIARGAPGAWAGTETGGRGRSAGAAGGVGGVIPMGHLDPALFSSQKRVTVSAGGLGAGGGRAPTTGGIPTHVDSGGGRGGSFPQGVTFTPGLSAGSDPGGGRFGGVNSRNGGQPRPPWSEQGNTKAAGSAHSTQLLYA